MKEMFETITVFAAVLLVVFLFTGPEPTPFKALQDYARGVCR